MKHGIDVTHIDGIIALQGQLIVVKKPGVPDRVFRFIHRADEKDGKPTRQLRMVYRVKGTPSVDWPVTQAFFDAAKRVNTPEAQWQIAVK